MLVIAVMAGCQKNDLITSWNSPRMLHIQHKWESLWYTARKTHGEKREKLEKMLNDILKKNLSKDDLYCLTETCKTLPVNERDWLPFHRAVLSEIVWNFTKSGERGWLTMLLSTRCPSQVYDNTDIEYFLLRHGNKLTDPILVLKEAYFCSQVPEVRKTIATAFRHGFEGLGVTGKDDTEFVKNAVQWYEKEKNHLVFNLKYVWNSKSPPIYYLKRPLFLRKATSSNGSSDK